MSHKMIKFAHHRFKLLLQILLLIIYLDEQADGFINSPKIITKDGNLIVESGLNRNITFRLGGSSRININDEYDLLDLLLVSGKRNGSLPMTNEIIEDQDLSQFTSTLSTLRTYVFGDNGLERRLRTMSNRTRLTIMSLRRLQNRFQRVERKVQNLWERLELDSCKKNPCENGGTCLNIFGGFICTCTKNFEGPTCQNDVNECALFVGTDMGCQNGAQCINQHGGYSCLCSAGWYGVHCTQRRGDCTLSSAWELCAHGTCVPSNNNDFGYKCICDAGWKTNGLTPFCNVDVDECTESHTPCTTQCINYRGSFACAPCPAGLTGNGINCRDIDECAINNGGCSLSPRVRCMNTYGSYHCGDCPLGWIGDGRNCEKRSSDRDRSDATAISCALNNYCHPLAKCTEVSDTVVCSCPAGMIGSGIGLNGCVQGAQMNCASLPCQNGGTCVDSGNDFVCLCPMGFRGPTCTPMANPCTPNPCHNNGRCRRTGGSQFVCQCTSGYNGRLCDNIHSRCGSILRGMTGHLKYPEGSSLYNHLAQCAWVISTNESLVLNVTFNSFELEDATECRFDWLQINDGRSAASQSIGRFCGAHKPRGGNIISSSSFLYLWFRSDNSTAKEGFDLEWNSVPPQCGGIIEVKSYGTISSPGSPGNYPKNRDCDWHLRAPNNKIIKLTFFNLEIEKHDSCNFDYLEIIDEISVTTIVKYCNTTAPSPLTLLTNEALIHFHSDNIESDSGFQIYYSIEESFPGCGGIYSARRGIIKAPNFNTNSISCEYDIKMSKSESIKIAFEKFEMGEDDCLEFFDVHPNTNEFVLQAKYCGSYGAVIPDNLHSLYNALRIKYHGKDGKFELSYKADCSYTFESESGEVLSPSYPKLNNIDDICSYKILTEPTTVISIKFNDFDIQETNVYPGNCVFSSLKIYDGFNMTSMGLYCGNNTPPVEFVSKMNIITFTLQTSNTTSGRGFRLEYRAIPTEKSACGGIFTKPGYKIRLPTNENNEYLSNSECYWVIMAPEGKGILINWLSFSLEKSGGCMFDYVEIYDNLARDLIDRPLGRYCDTPPSFSTHSRILTIKFVSDWSNAAEGFEATFQFVDLTNSCGGKILSSTGKLFSPDYPHNYTNGVDCIWVIAAPEHMQLKLDIYMFELQMSDKCENDWLEIRNGGSIRSPLIDQYCGTNIPRQIPSFTSQLRIHFHSDNFINARGFQIHWHTMSNGCGGNMKSVSGEIASPNFPNPYPYNAVCEWHVQVPKGSSIHFTIESINLELSHHCEYDYLEIYDGRSKSPSSLVTKLCNLDDDKMPEQLFTQSNEALIRFRSDSSINEGGFLLTYYANCSRIITDINGVIESPNLGNHYFNDAINCSWTIRAPKGNHIVLQFSHYEIADGGRNLVFEENGRNETIMHMLSPNDNYTTTENILTIIQNSSLMNFRLEYIMLGCVEVFHRDTGEFQSPNYPLPYSNDLECLWEIVAPKGQGVEVTILEIDIEETVNCTNDALVISSHYGGNNWKERHCGKRDKLIITSASHRLFVQFYSNKEHNGKGFTGSYKFVTSQCGGILNSKNGVITSPNYPLNYPPEVKCEWTFEVTEHHTMTLTMEDVQVENHPSCDWDFIEAYEVAGSDSETPEEESRLLFKKCNDSEPNVWTTNTNMAVMRFESDDSISHKGFKLSYKENCGQIKIINDTDIHYITLSRNSVTNENCEFILKATELNKHVQLTPTHVQLSPLATMSELTEEECLEQGVKVYDGEDDSAPLVSKFCKTHPPNIISKGHALTIKVPLNVTTEFEAYYEILDTWCGGYYMSISGKFASPLYPSSYPTNMDCEYYISATNGNSLVLTIESLDLETSEDCNKDYLEVRDTNENGRLIGVFCGKNISEPITGMKNAWVKFSSDNDGVDSGFLISYNYATHNELSSANGTLESPNYPSRFHADEPYTWRITVDKSYVVVLVIKHIIDVDIPYVMIFDGYIDIGLPVDFSNKYYIQASTNIVYIKALRGPFQIEWSSLSRAELRKNQTIEEHSTICGKNVYKIKSGQMAFINSPGYPYGYASDLKCNWILMPSNPGTHVVLDVATVDLEDMNGCFADYVVVSASTDLKNWNELERLCKKPENMLKEYHGTPHLRVSFNSDMSINNTGFASRARAACGSELLDRQGLINITSLLKGRQIDCIWKIKVRPSRRIRIQFIESYLTSENNANTYGAYFLVRNGIAEDSPFLGKGKYIENNINDILETSSNYAFIKFSRGATSNFKATFYYEEINHECSDVLILSENAGDGAVHMGQIKTITSPNYPNIPNPHTECIWRIEAPTHHIIMLEFENDFDLATSSSSSSSATTNNNCDGEYVQLNDGATELMPLLGIFCGKKKPNTRYTTGNILRIKYFTDIPEPHIGFNATVSIGRCGGSFYENEGIIQSPDYTTLLKDGNVDFECVYTIEVYGGSTIKLTIDNMNLPETKGCLKASNIELEEIGTYNGVENVTDTLRLCGERKADSYIVETNKMRIRFSYNGINRIQRTFKFTYSAIGTRCDETIRASRGVLYSPGYPQGMKFGTHCLWRIHVPKGKRVKVEILDFDIYGNLNVSTSNTSRTHSFGHMGPIRGRLTFANDFDMHSIIMRVSNNPPAIVYSTDNTMGIDAFLLSLNQHRGFKLRFSSDEPSLLCRQNLDGKLQFQRPYNTNIYCSYMLKPEDNETFVLEVNHYAHNQTFYFSKPYCTLSTPLRLELNGEYLMPGILCENDKPLTKPIMIRLPYPVTLKLNGDNRNKLINLELSRKTYKCGGIRTIYNDMNLTQPRMVNYTGGELQCAWAIWPFNSDNTDDSDYLSSSMQIEISLSTDFKSNCDNQYLIIYGGPNQNYPHLGRFCTQSSMKNVVVERGVFIEYYTQNYEMESQFNITMKEGSGCGGKLTYPYRSIIIGGEQYKNNLECIWELTTDYGFHIGVYFTERFFIESSKDCTKDYLLAQQRSINGNDWIDLGRYCGRIAPQSINSTTTELRIIFRTDDRNVGDGFTMHFDRNCGSILYATNEPQYMTSPGYPLRYDNNLFCNYTIIPKETSKMGLLLQFLTFEIEASALSKCLFDNVTVISYSNTLKIDYDNNDISTDTSVLCGIKKTLEFRGDKINVILRTDHTLSAEGFKFVYSTNICGYTITNTTILQTPRMFNDGSFPPNSECNWNLTAPDNYKILIKFEYFNYENQQECDFDGVKIYKSLFPVDDQRIAKLCGNLTGILPPLYIFNNHALIHSYSDQSVPSLGFKALITFLPKCDENIYLSADNATYDFYKYASGYQNNLDCTYVFTTTNGRQISATFNTFHIEDSENCDKDYLVLRDGGGQFGDLIGTFCGHTMPHRLMSSNNALFIRFVSDSTVTSTGFSMKILSSPKYCGNTELEVKSKEKVILNSINTPDQFYGKHLNCLWKLKSTKTMHLKFERFDLEGNNITGKCGGDTLRIYNSEDAEEIEKGYGTEIVFNGKKGNTDWSDYATDHVYCGNHLPDDYFSTSNTVLVKFQTDDKIEGHGFSLSAYAVEGCFRNFTGTQGRIQLAESTDECDIYVESPENYTLSLYYNSASFSHHKCEDEYVEVFDIHTNNSLQKICSYLDSEQSLFSRTNKLRLHMKMSGYYTKVDITYLASRDGPGCGGNLYNNHGTIISPFFPNNVRNNSNCRWNIRVPSNLHVLLQFEVFDFGTKNTCHTDYLEIIEKNKNGIDVIKRRFCGGDNPQIYKSEGSTLSIRFHKTMNYDGTGWVLHFNGVYSNYKIDD